MSDDDETIGSENEGIIGLNQGDDATLDIVHEPCKNINCKCLSNICRYLVNQTVFRVMKDPWRYYDYLRLWLGRARNAFVKVHQVCEILKVECKKSGKGALRKDYIEVVKKFGERFVFHLVFNLILREVLISLEKGEKGRIKSKNIQQYKNITRSIYRYSCEKLHIVPLE